MIEKQMNVPITSRPRFTSLMKFRELGLLGVIIVLAIIVQLCNPSFLTPENISDMLSNTAILSIMAVGMMLVIVTRGIDLSVGATLALAGMVAAMFVSSHRGIHPVFIILLGVVIGMLCGAAVGLLIAKLNILPIIASLGMMNVYRGLTYIYSGGKWVNANQMPASFKAIATSSIIGINTLIVLAVVVYTVFYYVMDHTRIGRQIYAVGSNPGSARVSGINNAKILWLVYVIMGGLSGLCGVLWVAKFASAQGDTATGFELNVIAACVLGGVSITGGSGKIVGVLLGSVLLGLLNNALPLVNVSPFWQNALQGFVILVAVIFNTLVKRRMQRNSLSRRRM